MNERDELEQDESAEILRTEADIAAIDLRAMPRVLRRLAVMAGEHPWALVGAVICTLGSTISALVVPGLLGGAIDHAHAMLGQVAAPEEARQALLVAALLVIAAGVVRGIFLLFQGYLYEYCSQRVGQKLRLLYFEKLQRLSFSFHDRIHSGDLITRGMLDVEGARVFVSEGMLRSVQIVLLVGAAGFLLLRADLTLGLIALSFVPIAAWRLGRMGFLLRVTWQRYKR